MFCVKCGKNIEEGQAFCTGCGEPVSQIEEIVNPTEEVKEKAVSTNEEVLEESVTQDVPVIENVSTTEVVEGPVIVGNVESVSNESAPKEKNTRAKVGVIVFLSVLIVGIIAWVILTRIVDNWIDETFNPNDNTNDTSKSPINDSNQSNSSSDSSNKKETKKNTKKVSYAGYQFEYSSDYSAKDMNETGLVFQNDELAFSVLVDYSHTYSDYKDYIVEQYGESEAEESYETLNGKSYIFFYQIDSSTREVTYVYATEAKGNHVFVGLFTLKTHGNAGLSDVASVEEVLSTATIDSSFTKQDDYDSGADDSYFPIFSANFYESEAF